MIYRGVQVSAFLILPTRPGLGLPLDQNIKKLLLTLTSKSNQTIQYWKVLLLSVSLELVVVKLEEFQWKTFFL